jgi:hypothetical protein
MAESSISEDLPDGSGGLTGKLVHRSLSSKALNIKVFSMNGTIRSKGGSEENGKAIEHPSLRERLRQSVNDFTL